LSQVWPPLGLNTCAEAGAVITPLKPAATSASSTNLPDVLICIFICTPESDLVGARCKQRDYYDTRSECGMTAALSLGSAFWNLVIRIDDTEENGQLMEDN
jgi:hypothetical protein